MNQFSALLRFSRPHTILATSFQVVGVFIIVMAGRPLAAAYWVTLVVTWLGSLAANLYVVGLNQIYDQPIDRVNKPRLPIASGEFSLKQGWGIVLAAAAVALLAGLAQDDYLLLTLALIMLIGTLYSVPPTRFKTRPVWAAASIAAARGVVANAGIYFHFQLSTQADTNLPRGALALALTFFFLFGIVIAIYKDIPDWGGDRQFQIRTFAVNLGRERVFRAGRWLLTGMYFIPILLGLGRLGTPGSILLVLAHATVLVLFWGRSLRTNPAEPASMMRLYLFLWGMFYAEYLILGLNSLLAA